MTRVIDTMQRIAHNAGIDSAQMFVTVTGIVVSLDDTPNAQVTSIERRTIDLAKWPELTNFHVNLPNKSYR